ncbi:MAG: type II toxin-antitoxin system VapC family toxin [Chlorobiaceae bacterium]|nr:type II toxin-antitoxin system VapC family toxin [Chlorobiaceae bacterium]
MNVVDSSGWLEFFADGPNAEFFSEPLRDIETVLVPSICYYEVFKVVLRQRNETDAMQAVALMQQAKSILLTEELAILAAKNSLHYRLPMADSIIITVAERYEAILWTQDADFKNLPGVRYISKEKSR